MPTKNVQARTLKVTLVKSPIGFEQSQRDTVRSLGLKKLNATVMLPDNPQIRGMVYKVRHLVLVEDTK